jgi:hypothetical protein
MDLRSIMNVLLIGLTLSTVVLTLIVYFIFKLRQGALRKTPIEPHLLEGVYFKRISPEKLKENIQVLNSIKEVQNYAANKGRIPSWGIFLLIFGSMILFIALDYKFSYHRMIMTKNFDKAIYKDLIQIGLLQDFEFSSDSTQNYFHFHRLISTHQTENNLDQLRSSGFYIFQNSTTSRREHQTWLTYLKSLGLRVYDSRSIPQANPGDVIILPSTGKISVSEHQKLKALRELGVGILFTGPLLENISCPSSAMISETVQIPLVRVDSSLPIPWSLPSHTTLQLRQASHCRLTSNTEPLASWKDVKNKQTYVAAWMHNNQRWIWSNLLPNIQPEYGSLEDLFWSQTFLYLSKSHTLKHAKWQKTKDFPISIVITGNDGAEFIPRMQQKLNEEKMPFTVFLNSETMLENGPALLPASDLIGYGSQSVQKENLIHFAVPDVFKKIQESRQNFEAFSRKKIAGFQFPQNQFTWDLVTAVQQNHFLYLLGKDDFSWRQPVPLASNFYYIPTQDFQIKNILLKKEISTNEDFIAYLKEKLEQTKMESGHAVLVLDPEYLGKEPQFQYFLAMIQELKSSYSNQIYSIEDVVIDMQGQASTQLSYLPDTGLQIQLESNSIQKEFHFWSTLQLKEQSDLALLSQDKGLFLYKYSVPENKQPNIFHADQSAGDAR